MNKPNPIFQVTEQVIAGDITIDQAIALLSGDKYRGLVQEDNIEEAFMHAIKVRDQNISKALIFARLSYETSQTLGEIRLRALASNTLGNLLFDAGQIANSIPFMKTALPYFRDHNYTALFIHTLDKLGSACLSIGDYQRAIGYWKIVLENAERPQDWMLLAVTLNNLGSAHLYLSDYPSAIDYCHRALQLAEKQGNLSIKGSTQLNLGIAFNQLGDIGKAIDSLEQALTIADETGDKLLREYTIGSLGTSYYRQGDFTRSATYYRQAIKAAVKIGDQKGQGTNLDNLGLVYSGQGEYYQALKCHRQALNIAIQIEDKRGQGNSLSNLGAIYDYLGQHSKAITHYLSALQIAQEIKYIRRQGHILGRLGIVYAVMGDYVSAIRYYEDALSIATNIGARSNQLSALVDLGTAHYMLGNYPVSHDHFQEALNLSQEIGDKHGEVTALGKIGLIQYARGDLSRAMKSFEKSISISNEIGSLYLAAGFISNLGLVLASMEKWPEAAEHFEKALAIAEKIGVIDEQAFIAANLGFLFAKKLKQNQNAYEYYKHSIELTERVRAGIKTEDQRASFIYRRLSAFDGMILLCNRMAKANAEKLVESFEYLERSKSRTFLESLGHTSLKASGSIPQELLAGEKTLLQEIKTLYLQREKQQQISLADMEGHEAELDEVWGKIEKVDPEYVSMRRGKPLEFSQIQSLLASQGDGVCLVEYFFSSDKLLIFILRSDSSGLQVEEVDFPGDRLSYFLKQYSEEFLHSRGEQHDLGQVWQGISRYLVAPIIKHMDGIETIYLVPFRQLHYLPLHALRHDGQYLIERYKVVYSPSASVISYCQNKRRPLESDLKSLVVGVAKEGDSIQLKHLIEKEADQVGIALGKGSSVHKGNQVTKELIKQESKGKDIIHFSCHGFFHPQLPMKSGLVLADGILTVEDIFQLDLDASLVTLSACQTGLSEHKPGDDLVGLTRSLLYAGTPSVLVSLWSVPATSTLDLMDRFYNYLERGMTKAEALQLAQLQTKDMLGYNHPYYWAPFVLVGDWK